MLFKYCHKLMLVLFLIFGIFVASYAEEKVNNTSLYILSATSGSIFGDQLVLKGINEVMYVTDVSKREYTKMSLDAFSELWDKKTEDFRNHPPSAILSILGGSTVRNINLKVLSAKFEGDSLSFQIKTNDIFQDDFKDASLFLSGI